MTTQKNNNSETIDYLQKWWEEKYPNAAVKDVRKVSECVMDFEDLIDFEEWIVKNYVQKKQ